MQLVSYIISLVALQLISIYSLSVNTINGEPAALNAFAGRKILFVNIASNSSDTAQLGKLEQLHQFYADRLTIIAVPSNDFGNEPLSNNEINTQLQEKYNIHYLLTEKQSVSDSLNISPLYQWLTKADQNGMLESHVEKDFYKYLVNKDGLLVGIFSDKVDPMNVALKKAILQ